MIKINIIENVFSAIKGVTGNKLRSSLTVFGIIVGIMSVIIITSIGNGIQKSMQSDFESSGINNLTVYSENDKGILLDYQKISEKDIELLKKYNDVLLVSPTVNIHFSKAVENFDKSKQIDVYLNGCDSDRFLMSKFELVHGRLLTKDDIKNKLPVTVIDENISNTLFRTTDSVGKNIEMDTFFGKTKVTVVGVLKGTDKSALESQFSRPVNIYMPYTFVKDYSFSPNQVDNLLVKVIDKERMEQISNNLIKILEVNHETKDIFKTRDSSGMLNDVLIIQIFTAFLTVVASISLIVGGIGVMNIMLVSVTERTREIGIRKSLGATNGNIRVQFLVESIILTCIGGALGLLLGYSLSLVAAQFISQALGNTVEPIISTLSIVLVIGLSSFIGIVFGVYPANKAAKLNTVDSLRFE